MTRGQGVGWQGEEEGAGWWGEGEGEDEQMVDLYVGMQEKLHYHYNNYIDALIHSHEEYGDIILESCMCSPHKYGTSF